MVFFDRATPERLSTFSDGVFAVLITVLVLELRPPEHETFVSLATLWPTGLSYAVSYLFIAIVWVNHHHVMRYATEAAPRVIWFNFAHLFSVSLLPLSTAWMAVSGCCGDRRTRTSCHRTGDVLSLPHRLSET
jgi:uncharacterized membrane protein